MFGFEGVRSLDLRADQVSMVCMVTWLLARLLHPRSGLAVLHLRFKHYSLQWTSVTSGIRSSIKLHRRRAHRVSVPLLLPASCPMPPPVDDSNTLPVADYQNVPLVGAPHPTLAMKVPLYPHPRIPLRRNDWNFKRSLFFWTPNIYHLSLASP